MFKYIVACLLFVALCNATPQSRDALAQILKQSQDVLPDGSYSWAIETNNGIAAQESGQQKQVGNEAGTVAQGSSQYTSPEGQQISLQYVADENGFQPSGAHLPVPPPTPNAILKSLAWNAAHPEEGAPQPLSKFQGLIGGGLG